MSTVIELFTNFTEVSLFFYFILHMLKPKDAVQNKLKYVIIMWTVGLICLATVLNTIKVDAVISMPIFLLSQLLFIFVYMQGGITEKLLKGCVFIVIDLISDSVALAVSDLLSPKTAQELVLEYPQRYILIALYLLILITLTLIFSRDIIKKSLLPRWILVIFTSLIIGAVIAVQGMTRLSLNMAPEHGKLIYSIMSIILFIIIFTIMMMIFLANMNISLQLFTEKRISYFYRKNGVKTEINLKNVKYINSDLRVVCVNMIDGQIHTFYDKLDTVFEDICKLYPNFVRINKSFVVNKSHINKSTDKGIFIDDIEIKISSKYYEDYSEKFLQTTV